jgi:hypothetical protein
LMAKSLKEMEDRLACVERQLGAGQPRQK